MAVHIMKLLITFLLTCSHMSIYSCSYSTAHYMYNQADFHGILHKILQVSVSHITLQTIMYVYILFVNFIHLQYICPLNITSKWLSIYKNPKPNILHFMF